jgi:hypothetical protein
MKPNPPPRTTRCPLRESRRPGRNLGPYPVRIKRHSLRKSGVQLASPITWASSPARSTTLSTRATALLRLRRPQLSLPVRAGGCAPLLGPRLAVTQHRNVGVPAGHRTEGQCRSSAVAGRDAAHPVNGREGDILLARGAALPQRRVGVHAGECDGQVDPTASHRDRGTAGQQGRDTAHSSRGRAARRISGPNRRTSCPSSRKGGGLVDAAGRGLVGANSEYFAPGQIDLQHATP